MSTSGKPHPQHEAGGGGGGGSADSHTHAVKAKAQEAGQAAYAKISQASAALQESAADVAQESKETAAGAPDVAAVHAHLGSARTDQAKGKLPEVGTGVQTALHRAVEYIKDHLPAAVHPEDDRQTDAMLEEAMARAPTNPETATATAAVAVKSAETDHGPPGVVEQGPGAPHPTAAEHAAADANRSYAAGLVRQASKGREAKPHAGDAALAAPSELQAPVDSGERHPHHYHGVHEVSALPGDIHIPLITRAIREKILHEEPGAGAGGHGHASGAAEGHSHPNLHLTEILEAVLHEAVNDLDEAKPGAEGELPS